MPEKKARKRAPSKAARKPTLRWLKIHQFRHVEPCELHFSETYNVLLGLNGTGKTTLLEIIAAALRFDFSKMKKEAFFIEYEIELKEGTIWAAIRNEALPAVSPSVTDDALGRLVAPVPPHRPSAEVTLTDPQGTRRVSINVSDAGCQVSAGDKVRNSPLRANTLFGSTFLVSLVQFLAVSLIGEWRWLISALGLWFRINRFDEALGFLRLITGASTRVDVKRRDGEIFDGPTTANGPVPESLRGELERQAREWKTVEPVVTLTSGRVDLLAQIAAILNFTSVQVRLTHLGTEVTGPDETVIYGEMKFMLERPDGSVISHELLSYGQKRALSFLYYLAVNKRTVIADELVDGLHHSWIEECIEAIGDRQCFLASQNPLLLDYLEFKSIDQVRTSFVQCRLKKKGKTERMVWSNMTEYDAARFFEAYGVGLQHVSEILRTKGLW